MIFLFFVLFVVHFSRNRPCRHASALKTMQINCGRDERRTQGFSAGDETLGTHACERARFSAPMSTQGCVRSQGFSAGEKGNKLIILHPRFLV